MNWPDIDDKDLAMLSIVLIVIVGIAATTFGYGDNGLATNAISAIAGMAVGKTINGKA